MKEIIIGLSGHIDHGKTSLIKSLTNKFSGSLKEDANRGMTIDIGFAHLSENITIIDVPGHEKFIKNMVTGVSSIDFAVLVIAADDGVMPQTKEHFEILKILNVKKGIILINKIDLVKDDWVDLVISDIQDLVKGSFLENQPIFKISAIQNIGINKLKKFILDTFELDKANKENDRGLFRMYIDRVFSQQGFGTVVTGTVISGSIKIKESINVLPVNKKARLRSAQSHYNQVETLNLGDRAALNLHGIEKNEVSRGDHLSNLEAFNTISQFLANITVLDNDDIILKQNQRLRFHIGTSEVIGRISICQKNTIQSGEKAICLIKLEEPVVISFNDQFLIRTYSPMRTIGGGRVEDINCLGKWKDLKQYAIELIKNNSIEDKIYFIIENQLGHPFKKQEIISRFGISFEKIIEYLEPFLIYPDDITFKYMKGRPCVPSGSDFDRSVEKWRSVATDADAQFDKVICIDASELAPYVTWGTTPDMVVPVTGSIPEPSELNSSEAQSAARRALEYMDLLPGTAIQDISLDRVFIGSCTNSRLSDLEMAADVIKGHHVHPNVRAMVVPGSTTVKHEAEKLGIDKMFLEAGFEWREAGCSMCLGMNEDTLSPGERCASTSNRNFEGRQGKKGRTHLVSPQMAAAAAIAGHFVDIRKWGS